MKHSIKKFLALLLCAATLASSICMAPPAHAAQTLYDDDFETIAKVGEANKCYSAQGFAVGDAYLYASQIGDDDARAVIHRVERDTGKRVLMKHSETGLSYFTNLGHCNDMDWAVIDGVEYLYVLAKAKVVVFRIEDTTLHPHAEYDLKKSGKAFSPSAMAVYEINESQITFLLKSGYTVYTGAVSATAAEGTISVSVQCYIDVSQVNLDGTVQDFTSFTNQGMGYEDGYLFVPITGNKAVATQSHSLILTYDMSQAKGKNKLQPVDEMTFYVISEKYAGLFEIEDCGISSDGRLYFNNNGRVSSRDTKHDGVHVLTDFVLETKKEATYTVQYDGNGGTGTMASATVAVDTPITPAENTFTRDGYTFTGWKAYSTAKKQYVNIGDKADEGDTIIFYAQWHLQGMCVRGQVTLTGPHPQTFISLNIGMTCLYSVSIPASMESGAQVVDFCFTDVAPGTYDLKILQINKLPFTVQGIPVTVGAEDLDLNTSSDALTNFVLLSGDVNGDGCIDLQDVVLLTSSETYSKSYADAKTKAADVNGDGLYDLQDLIIITSEKSYGKRGVEVVFAE